MGGALLGKIMPSLGRKTKRRVIFGIIKEIVNHRENCMKWMEEVNKEEGR